MKPTSIWSAWIVVGAALALLVGGCGNRACVLAEPLAELPCGLCSWCWTEAPPCPTACPPECPDCQICPPACPIACPKACPPACPPVCPTACPTPCPTPCPTCPTAAPCPQPCPTDLHVVVRCAVEDALSSKGYVKGAEGAPTFYVSQQSWLVRKCDGVTQDPYFSGRYGVYTSYDLEPRAHEDLREQAKVIIEFRKTKDCPPFWRGMATVNLDADGTAAERAEQVRCAVLRAIMEFPARGEAGG